MLKDCWCNLLHSSVSKTLIMMPHLTRQPPAPHQPPVAQSVIAKQRKSKPPKRGVYPDGSVYYGQPAPPHVVEEKVKVNPQMYGRCCGGTKRHDSAENRWEVAGRAEKVMLCNGCKRELLPPPPLPEWARADGWTAATWAEFEAAYVADPECGEHYASFLARSKK